MPGAVAIKTGLAKGPGQVAPGSFAGHLNQSQFGQRQNIGLAFVFFHGLGEQRHHFFFMGLFFHVNEINDDDPADVAQPGLIGNLLDRFQVGF